MLTVILIMSAGLVVGAFGRSRKRSLAVADRVVTYAIWMLLFLLGISIGTNRAVIENIGHLGFQAIVITAFAVTFSVLLSYLLFVFVFKHEK